MQENYKKYAKYIGVTILVIIVVITMVVLIKKIVKSQSAKKKREELIKTVVQEATTPDKKTYASVAIELEKLIFNTHNKIYGWEADIDAILRLMARYNKQEMDKVLDAYSMIYRPSEAGGTYLGEVVLPFDYVFAPRKEYTGTAFGDLESIEDEKDYQKVLESYKLLK